MFFGGMMSLGGLIWLLLAAGSAVGGMNFLVVSASTRSAIHELEGLVGLGFAVVFLGQAILMFSAGGAATRLDAAADAREKEASKGLTSRIPSHVRAAAFVLRSMGVTGKLPWGEQERLVNDFVAKALDLDLDKDQRRIVSSWLSSMDRTESSLATALDRLPELSRSQKQAFAAAGEGMVRGAHRKTVEAQQDLVDRAWDKLNASEPAG